MPDLAAIIQGSAAHAWLYLPVAVLLGAMHARLSSSRKPN